MNSIVNYITNALRPIDKKRLSKFPLSDIADALLIRDAKTLGIDLSGLSLNDRFYQAIHKANDTEENNIRFLKTVSRYYLHTLWEKKKQIYVFDPVFAEELMHTQNIGILKDMFTKLPYDTFAVDFSKSSAVIEEAGIMGAIINVQRRGDYWYISLSCFADLENGEMGFGILNFFVENENIECSSEKFTAIHSNVEQDTSLFANRKSLFNLIVHVLTYFSSYEPDIRETSQSKAQQAAFKRQKKTGQKPTRIWNVGEYYGAAFRKWTQGTLGNKSNNDVVTESKRPHVRRAHWHRYWVGKKGNQELVVKWVHDCIVNEHLGELSIAKHTVKTEKQNT